MERSWFGRRKAKKRQGGEKEDRQKVVVDGTEIRELVGDREAFGMFAESKFRELDADGDGRLSVRELQPAVAGIGAALGLPAQGSDPNADHIYSEAMSEVTQGKQEGVSRAEFQEVLSDILLGMAAGLKRDPIVILRIDGEDLRDFVSSPRYEPAAAAIFSQAGSEDASSLRQRLLAAVRQLGVDHGMPPAADPWVLENVIEPALQRLSADQLEQPVASKDIFLEQLKKLLSDVVERLQERPVIVAHTENTFDGSGVRRLLANKFELDKLLDSVCKDVPVEHKKKASKECLRAALDKMADAASLPPHGSVTQVDAIVDEALKMANNAHDGKAVDEAEFKKLLTEVLGAVMLRLSGDPVFISTSTVVHESLSSSSTLLSSPAVPSPPSE